VIQNIVCNNELLLKIYLIPSLLALALILQNCYDDTIKLETLIENRSYKNKSNQFLILLHLNYDIIINVI
jgi:hypothetical protein